MTYQEQITKLDKLEQIVQEGAEVIEKALGQPYKCWKTRGPFKIDKGIPADKLSHIYLSDKLKQEFPNSVIISEETLDKTISQVDTLIHRSGFIIDPLDGTGNASGSRSELKDIYGISIASFEKGTITGGIVFFPKKNLLFRSDKFYLTSSIHQQNPEMRVISGGAYTNLMTRREYYRVRERIRSFEKYLSETNSAISSKYCATYDILRTINPSDPAIAHFSPSLLYIWDVAAAVNIAEKNGMITINLETGRRLSCIQDFLSIDTTLQSPIGALTGSKETIEGFIKNKIA